MGWTIVSAGSVRSVAETSWNTKSPDELFFSLTRDINAVPKKDSSAGIYS